MRRCVGLALIGLAAPVAAAQSQAAVSGQVALIERQGAERSDLRDAVVYLEPLDHAVRGTRDGELRQASIAMTGREFVPHILIVLAGGSVSFPNQDPFSHNVFSNAGKGFDLGLYRRGVSKSAEFATAGVYPVYCNIHSRMVSFVIAVPSPLAVFVNADGRFAIPDVPAGRYRMYTWHERATNRFSHEIDVPAAGLTGLRIVLDARAYVSGPHLNKFGLPYAATRVDRY